MGIPKNHHFIPQSLISEWKYNGRYWCVERLKSGQVICPKSKMGTKSIHSVDNMNSALWEKDTFERLEREVFSPDDDLIAKMLQKIRSSATTGRRSLSIDPGMVEKFGRACVMMWFRHPIEITASSRHAIERSFALALEGWPAGVEPNILEKQVGDERMLKIIKESAFVDAMRCHKIDGQVSNIVSQWATGAEVGIFGIPGESIHLSDTAFKLVILHDNQPPFVIFPASPHLLCSVGPRVPVTHEWVCIWGEYQSRSISETSHRIVVHGDKRVQDLVAVKIRSLQESGEMCPYHARSHDVENNLVVSRVTHAEHEDEKMQIFTLSPQFLSDSPT